VRYFNTGCQVEPYVPPTSSTVVVRLHNAQPGVVAKLRPRSREAGHGEEAEDPPETEEG
jgi:hypothetical protein